MRERNREITISRFAKKVKVGTKDECWEWQGSKDDEGYGVVFTWERGNNERAHRVALKVFGHTVPNDKFVLHHCDNKSCVNPYHLYVGTNQDNMNDMKARKKHKLPHSTFKKGHISWNKGVKCKWITNGAKNRIIRFNEPLPDGFWLGRTA